MSDFLGDLARPEKCRKRFALCFDRERSGIGFDIVILVIYSVLLGAGWIGYQPLRHVF